MYERIELFLGFAALVANLSMFTELNELLVRQKSACFKCSQFLELGVITHEPPATFLFPVVSPTKERNF
jgi:hypothetical protein